MTDHPKLLNPFGTATRQDLVDLITILNIILTGSPEASAWRPETMIDDLIRQLNKQV